MTKKQTHSGSSGNMKFVSSEMQGNLQLIQAGARTWRMQPSTSSISEMAMASLLSLTATGVNLAAIVGTEVSIYVSEIFVDVLKETPEYKKKDYVKALNEAFRIVDEKVESEEGAKKLLEIRKRFNNGSNESSYERICNGTGCTANVMLITP